MKQPKQVAKIWFNKYFHDGLTIKAVKNKGNECLLMYIYPNENDRRNESLSFESACIDYSLDDHPDNSIVNWKDLSKGIQALIIDNIEKIKI